MSSLKELIEGLQILLVYDNPTCPTHCEHDELTILVDPSLVSDEDKKRLEEMGINEDKEWFYSFRYGSA